jgi:hypothetical protein
VQGVGCRIKGSGFRVLDQVLGFRVQDVQGSEFKVNDSGFMVSG